MILTTPHTIDMFDTAHDNTLRLESMARFFQNLAVAHSTRAGAGPEMLLPKGLVWYLHRLEIRVHHYPLLGEQVRLATWSRGFRQYMGLREYTITSDRGTAVTASSVWVFFNFHKNRILRVPEDMARAYASDSKSQFEDELYQWQPEKSEQTAPQDHEIDMGLRYGDFDLNGHVNNTVYPGIVETLGYGAAQNHGGEMAKIRHLKLRLGKEIPLGTQAVSAGFREHDGRYHFKISGKGTSPSVHADGEFSF
ncbi:MAG: thioesterase [Desulfobacterales bacterium]|nr:thioesterase [Desulfobacterales bacterium]